MELVTIIYGIISMFIFSLLVNIGMFFIHWGIPVIALILVLRWLGLWKI